MRILATDVFYDDTKNTANAAGVLFANWTSDKVSQEFTVQVTDVAPYEPGAFYKRELPCLLKLLDHVGDVDVVIVDSYVDITSTHPGLGRHLFNALNGQVPIVGVAKSHFRDSEAAEVYRGASSSPLYVTAAGLDLSVVAEHVRNMHGAYRFPTILQRVDALSRGRK